MDPALGPLVRKRPGLTIPCAWNAFEASGNVDPATHGTLVPGLPGGLTHTLPDAVLDLPATDWVAFRLGQRDAFPCEDPTILAALDELGLTTDDTLRWRPWRALAVVHLLAYKQN
jgi:AraC family transcriptional regulator, regulatory protein of adaptative response / DNA-3-methyladenine glycosylase II